MFGEPKLQKKISELVMNWKRKEYADQHLFGIDFDPRSVKIGKAMMLIVGDGKTNVSYANSLDSELWDGEVKARFGKFYTILMILI